LSLHAALLLLVQPLFAYLSLSAAHSAPMASPLGDTIVICTAKGAVAIDQSGSLPSSTKHQSNCPCCSLGCLSGCKTAPSLALISLAFDFNDFEHAEKSAVDFDDWPKPFAHQRAFSSRGPPSQIG
jgi:hypothetical protein